MIDDFCLSENDFELLDCVVVGSYGLGVIYRSDFLKDTYFLLEKNKDISGTYFKGTIIKNDFKYESNIKYNNKEAKNDGK
jgi:hypothetical protein